LNLRTCTAVSDDLYFLRARIAPVGFMFQRNGRVKLLLEKDSQFDEMLEKAVEIAVDNGSEDFETYSVGEGQEEVEVS